MPVRLLHCYTNREAHTSSHGRNFPSNLCLRRACSFGLSLFNRSIGNHLVGGSSWDFISRHSLREMSSRDHCHLPMVMEITAKFMVKGADPRGRWTDLRDFRIDGLDVQDVGVTSQRGPQSLYLVMEQTTYSNLKSCFKDQPHWGKIEQMFVLRDATDLAKVIFVHDGESEVVVQGAEQAQMGAAYNEYRDTRSQEAEEALQSLGRALWSSVESGQRARYRHRRPPFR